MSTQIVSTRGMASGRRGIAGRVGKGPVIGVAIIVLLVAALLGGHVITQHGSASHNAKATDPSAFIPAVSAARYYDELMSQQEDWTYMMAARATMRRAAAQYNDLMSQQEDWIHTMAARADALLLIPSAQQRFLEENTITLSSVGGSVALMPMVNE
jgi:hypothetical protein